MLNYAHFREIPPFQPTCSWGEVMLVEFVRGSWFDTIQRSHYPILSLLVSKPAQTWGAKKLEEKEEPETERHGIYCLRWQVVWVAKRNETWRTTDEPLALRAAVVPRECGAVLSGSLALQDAFELHVQLSALLHMSSKMSKYSKCFYCHIPVAVHVGLVRWHRTCRGVIRGAATWQQYW